mgnify:CR=1 FL=1
MTPEEILEVEKDIVLTLKNIYDPEIPVNIYDLGLISINMDTDNSMYVDEIKYVGDINIESYNEYEGMGYSELYCHIPNNAIEKRYHCVKNSGEDFKLTSNQTIEGYNEAELGAGAYVSDHPLTYIPYTVIDGNKRNTFEFSWDDIGSFNALSRFLTQYKNNNILTDIKTIYIDDLCVDENIRGKHIASILSGFTARISQSQRVARSFESEKSMIIEKIPNTAA